MHAFFRLTAIVSGFSMLILGTLLGLPALMFRFDNLREYREVQVADLLVGCLFGGGCGLLLWEISHKRPNQRHIGKIITGLIVAGVVAGSLLGWHKALYHTRFDGGRLMIARNAVHWVRASLKEYKQDCGSLPTTRQGLMALVRNPGVEGWAGPYLPAEESYLDSWGRAILYRTEGEDAVVWSLGPDGRDATPDDILMRVNVPTKLD